MECVVRSTSPVPGWSQGRTGRPLQTLRSPPTGMLRPSFDALIVIGNTSKDVHVLMSAKRCGYEEWSRGNKGKRAYGDQSQAAFGERVCAR